MNDVSKDTKQILWLEYDIFYTLMYLNTWSPADNVVLRGCGTFRIWALPGGSGSLQTEPKLRAPHPGLSTALRHKVANYLLSLPSVTPTICLPP